MAAPITNEPYSEQVSRAFDALKFATPQQLAMTAQAVQGNPQSPEALALASANNFQQQQRAAGAQMPQQTVYQQQIGKLLASLQPPPQPAPMQGGIAGVGANQFAMQDAAMQDPMRNAGIGAAPENMPMQQAAAGGLIALAHGGPVDGYAFGGNMEVPETGSEMFPIEEEEEEEDTDFARADEQLENETGAAANPHLDAKNAVPKTKSAPQDGADIHTPAPGSSAARAQKKSSNEALKTAANELLDVYGPSYSVSPDLLSKLDKMEQGATRDKWIGALASGIGNLLSAQTPHLGQAVGQGLIGGFAGYQHGAKEESDIQKQLLQLQMATEKEAHADKRSAVQSVLSQAAAATKARQQRELEEYKQGMGFKKGVTMASILAGGRGAANMVDPNERQQRINDLFGKLQTNQRNKLDATLTGLSDEELYSRAARMVDSSLQGAAGALQGVNPSAANPVQFLMMDESGFLR